MTPLRPLLAAATLALIAAPLPALAHCDTLDGPVVTDAREALEAGNVTPVLKWVAPAQEGEVRNALARTLAVRGGSPEARELADTWFFETVVRLHRQTEGAPFTGLKPAGETSPPIRAADAALEQGSVDELVERAQAELAEAVRTRFAAVLAASRHQDESVAAGRGYVREYVAWVHYLEGLHAAVHGGAEAAAGHDPSAASHGHAGH